MSDSGSDNLITRRRALGTLGLAGAGALLGGGLTLPIASAPASTARARRSR